MKPVLSRISSPLRVAVLTPLAAALVACGGGGGSTPQPTPEPDPGFVCAETGPYACKSGETEPLYTFQWALNYLQSYFQTHADVAAFGGGLDLNVEPVHRQGIKGQGVNVLVIDTGTDLQNEDLAPNANYEGSWNYDTRSNDPNPMLTGGPHPHGTLVAGIIGAAQNGKGVMGIAPQAKLAGVPLVGTGQESVTNMLDAYGGAAWSRDAHVINASYGHLRSAQPYALPGTAALGGVRGLKALRNGKGVVFVKSAGNAFDDEPLAGNGIGYSCGPLTGNISCYNPANEAIILEPNIIVTAALNAKGQASSYSSAGSVVWITGMGGEFGSKGNYGESSGLTPAQIATGRTGDGPTLFSTDIRGCAQGASQSKNAQPSTPFTRGESTREGVPDNPRCDYAYMNGTSAAAPTVTGVVALILSANPELSWRDVRDILRESARAVDPGYEKRKRNDVVGTRAVPYNALLDLKTNTFLPQSGAAAQIGAGSTQVPVELGWQKNASGLLHSNWYGFGVPDAAKAVELAQRYKKEPARSKPAAQAQPDFTVVKELTGFEYEKVTLLGEFDGADQTVDALQLRLSGTDICLGSLGLAVESPAGTKSLLKMPLDHFVWYGQSDFVQYGAGSYAFYGENAKGKWKIYAVASNPRQDLTKWQTPSPALCEAAPAAGSTMAAQATLKVEARVIAQ